MLSVPHRGYKIEKKRDWDDPRSFPDGQRQSNSHTITTNYKALGDRYWFVWPLKGEAPQQRGV